MENEVFGAARRVPCELLNVYPSALERTVQDLTRSLVDKVVCELEKGESICSLQTVEQNQFSDIYSVEIRRTVKITRLVRCRECKFSTMTYQGEMKYCKKLARKDEYGDFNPTFYVSGDWFCADGVREVQDANKR